MHDTNGCWRLLRPTVTAVLGLLLALTATACNGGPTEPTFDELAGVYSGRWRGTVNGWQVVLDVQAEQGNAERWIPVQLGGTATALNPATGESHGLTINGQTTGGSVSTMFWLSTPLVTGPGGVILGGGQGAGQFIGGVSADRRTWSGRFASIPSASGLDALIFGRGEYDVTFMKD